MIPAAESMPALMTGLQTFLMEHGATLPEHTRNALLESAGHPSPVDRIVNSAEALYAAKEDLPKEGREIGAQLALFAASNGFHGMSTRGVEMASAYNRIGGYAPPPGQSWPVAEDDPEPLPRFLPEPEPNAGEPAAAPATPEEPAPEE